MPGAAILQRWPAVQGWWPKSPFARHPCGTMQSGGGETVTLMLSRDGASGGFLSSAESGPRGALGEGQGLGARRCPRPASKRRGSGPLIPRDSLAEGQSELGKPDIV